jgi:tRNA dimethylallyltransferase
MKVISEFQQRETPSEEEQAQVWHEAVQYVSTMGHPFDDRAATLGKNDWYRLRRLLEVAYTSQEQQHHGDGEQNDFAPSLQLEELYTGKRGGALETFGWDVRCFFLCPDDRMAHTEVLDRRCEEMVIRGLIQETADLLLQGQLPVMAARAIGYRQTLDYLQRENAQMNNRAALEAYLNEFTTSTRRYAKRQMQWFRRDQKFVFVPVSVSVSKEERILTAAGQIYDMVRMSLDQFDQECFTESSISQQTRSTNEKQGKEMRLYQFRRYLLTPEAPIYSEILQQADECTRRIQESQKRLILEDQTEGTVGNRLIAFE